METNELKEAVIEIIKTMKSNEEVIDDKWLAKFVRSKNREQHDSKRIIAKRRLMPEYLRLKREEPAVLDKLKVDAELNSKIIALLQAKPRRTASGVATITVLTKPWPCSGNCVFCPNDIRMPKSYIHNEPACQRAERWGFDPYDQVTSRLTALYDMGHNIDKIELIVLGGTFSDYKRDYQIYYIKELFRACNDFQKRIKDRKEASKVTTSVELDSTSKTSNLNSGVTKEDRLALLEGLQIKLNKGELSYNDAWREAYAHQEEELSSWQTATFEQLNKEQIENETSGSRVVGLVVETRPDSPSIDDLVFLRQLGCTKIQIGIQTLDPEILKRNCRAISPEVIGKTMENLRLLGFKSHVHIMANLMGSTPDVDKKVYHILMTDPSFQPDEVKIYPCCLVESAHLTKHFETGEWKPYSEEELLDIVVSNIADTPAHTRISRMIRDISTTDIIAGNKKPNLRQLVEEKLREKGNSSAVQEMRFREIATDEIKEEDLRLEDVVYETSNTTEHFLQWVTGENRLAGFLRLSLPKAGTRKENTAMIREVHIYGKVARIHHKVKGAQHLGLGTKLIACATEIATENDRKIINVISAVGTREYYRSLGFQDGDLYQFKKL